MPSLILAPSVGNLEQQSNMKQFAELIPIALFFIVYQMNGSVVEFGGWSITVDGIFTATQVLIAATTVQVAITVIIAKRLEKKQIGILVAIWLFGGLTLIYRDQTFIQLKPTIFNWVLAIAFMGSQFIGDKNLMERTLGKQLKLPKNVWARINWLWITNFIVVGALNLVVAYNYSESIWVSYKLYSAIGFTLVLSILTVIVLTPYLKDQDLDKTEEKK
jgi:intracellular septation protein